MKKICLLFILLSVNPGELVAAQRNPALEFLSQVYSPSGTADLSQFLAPGFRDHDLGLDEGAAGWTARALEFRHDAHASWNPARSVVSGDLAAVHSRLVLSDHSWIVADFFRSGGGKFLEHWRVIQPEAKTSANGHTMVDGDPGADGDDAVSSKNKTAVETLIGELFTQGNRATADQLVDQNYIQHNPMVKNGRAPLKAIFGGRKTPIKVHFVVAQVNLVFAFLTYPGVMAVDLFRVEGGLIREHWDVIQSEPSGEDIPEGRTVY